MCAIESAAKNNRNFRVHVLSIHSQLDRQLQPLIDIYPNIVLMKFMPIELFRDTPLFAWWQTGRVFKSPYMLAHISDAARLALLWKYGGVYSDLDTITIKSFQSLIGLSASSGSMSGGGVGYLYENGGASVGNGVLVFQPEHRFLKRVMDSFVDHYDPYTWGANGPTTFLYMLKDYCGVSDIGELMTPETVSTKRDESKNQTTAQSSSSSRGDRGRRRPQRWSSPGSPCDVSVFPEDFFYPLRYSDDDLRTLFEPDHEVNNVARKLTNTYSVHCYGFKSKDMKVSTRQTSLYGFLASCNCELTYRHLDSNGLLFE